MYRYLLKNVLSSGIALIFILLFWPVLALIALAIKIEDPTGPVLFTQKRIGIHKGYFNIYKFRTMRTDTPHDVPTHLLDADKYITKVGRILRKYSLDELPQVFNILQLKNGMVWVGPRPALWNQYDLIAERDKYGANDVYPGLTGWAQIHGRDELEIPEKARLDGYYVKHLSPIMDLRCIFGTIISVLNASGVVEGGTGALNRAQELQNAISGKKKILFVANVAKEHVLKFHVPTIKEFVEHGWIVDVACSGNEKVPFCHKQYQMSWTRSPFTKDTIRGIVQLKKILDKNKYDVVYCHTPVGGIAARLAAISARQKGTKLIYCAHGFHFFKGAPAINWLVYYPVERFLAYFTDEIFTVNLEDYLEAQKHFTKKVKIKLIPEVGVDFSRFQVNDRQEVRKQYREQLHIPQDAYVMIYVAELISNKNQIMLINTLKILRERAMNVYLVLPGPDHANGYYQQYAKEQGMLKYCRFLGWRNDIGQLMVTADVCTASSIREGFGINLVEAMYCGLPVVATNNRGHQMVIKNESNGYLVPIDDYELMAEKVLQLYRNYNNCKQKFSNQNVSMYDCRQIAKIIYRRVAGEKNDNK